MKSGSLLRSCGLLIRTPCERFAPLRGQHPQEASKREIPLTFPEFQSPAPNVLQHLPSNVGMTFHKKVSSRQVAEGWEEHCKQRRLLLMRWLLAAV